MSLLKRAIDARARVDRPTLQAGVVSLGDIKSHAVGFVSGDGSVSIVSSRDSETDRDRLRQLERVLEWDSLPHYDIAAVAASHAAYERSRVGDVDRKKKAKKKKEIHGLEGVRDRYI